MKIFRQDLEPYTGEHPTLTPEQEAEYLVALGEAVKKRQYAAALILVSQLAGHETWVLYCDVETPNDVEAVMFAIDCHVFSDIFLQRRLFVMEAHCRHNTPSTTHDDEMSSEVM